jgi:ankyrin repeat protein
MFAYFAPEICDGKPQLAERFISNLGNSAETRRLPSIFRAFADDLEGLQADHWHRLKNKRNFFKNQHSLFSILQLDDLPALQAVAQNPNFSVDVRIAPSLFMPSSVLFSHPSLVQAAAFFGAANCFRWLLLNGADIVSVDRDFLTLPQLAIAGGNIEIVRICQQYRLDFQGTIHAAVRYHRHSIFDWLWSGGVCDTDFLGQTPLHTACDTNNVRAIWDLANAGEDLNAESIYRGSAPLRIVAQRGHLEALRCLLSFPGVNLEAKPPGGRTALSLAVKYGDLDVAAMLLAAGADCRDAILVATQYRQGAMVEFLLAHTDADPNFPTAERVAPLLGTVGGAADASVFGRDSIARALIADPRVNVNAKCREGLCVLYYAIKRGNKSVFDCLMARPDIDLAVRGNNGNTLLHAATRDARMTEALLKRRVVDVNAVDARGETALHKAIAENNLDVVDILLAEPEINVNIVTGRGATPLHYALAGRRVEIAEKLIAFPSTDVNVASPGNPVPIALAIRENLISCVQALCTRADLKITGLICDTPLSALQAAAYYGNKEILELLLKCPLIKIEDEECGAAQAIAIARKKGFTECEKLLRPEPASENKTKKRNWFLRTFCSRAR